MLKKIIKSIIIIAIVLVLALSRNIMIVLAVTDSDLNDIQGQIDDTEEKIDHVEEELSTAMEQIRSLNAEIAEYENEIADLDTKIEDVTNQISETEAQLQQAEEDYNEQEILLQQRLLALYESGNTTYLDVLLSSKSITDFISKYYIVSEIAESDRNLLEKMEENKNSINETKQMLQTSKEQIEALKASKEDTANSLKSSQAVKQSYIDQLNDEEKALQEELEQFERDKKAIQEELKRIAMENNGGSPVIPGEPSEAGYIFPVAGLNIYNINRRYYPSYPGHTGVDININVIGKSVVAAKGGTVVTSEAAYGSIPAYDANGNYVASYRSYGEYIIINHHDGTMTLYGHLKPGSRLVSEGQTVQQGQVIATVGNTGNCQPRPSSSNPNNGTHLHFEVRINGRCVNPLPYLQ